MRSVWTFVLVLGLSSAVYASAHAAGRHYAKPRHADVYRSRNTVPNYAAPARNVDPRYPPVLEDQTPAYDDPSKFGGG